VQARVSAAVLALLWSLSVPSLQGQEAGAEGASAEDAVEDAVPVLVSGPTPGSGLPFLPPNALQYYRGLYELPGQDITVYYTRRTIVPLSSWNEARCGGYVLRTFNAPPEGAPQLTGRSPADIAAGGPLLAYYEGEGFYLFFSHGSGLLSCSFIEAFIPEFLFFLRNEGSARGDGAGSSQVTGSAAGRDPSREPGPPPPFPAVLGG
jgi:hypothetical protein